MSVFGRGRGDDRGQRNGRGGGRQGRGRRPSAITTNVKGACPQLNDNVFDYNRTGAADKLKTSMKKIVTYVGTHHGPDIAKELQNRKELVIDKPTHTQAQLAQHALDRVTRNETHTRMTQTRQQIITILEAKIMAEPTDIDSMMLMSKLRNEAIEADANHAKIFNIILEGDEKIQHEGKWRTYRDRVAKLEVHRGMAYSLIYGQCTQPLKDRMFQDSNWTTIAISNNALELIDVMERTVLAPY